ncbi:hypothetical protein V8F20_006022 [Naviculisporaceae sp. PSN 640]
MGQSQSKVNKTISEENPGPAPAAGFPEPVQDPESTLQDPANLPLEGRDITAVSVDELLTSYNIGRRIHDYFGKRMVRISRAVVIKSGPEVTEHEAYNMKYASENPLLPVPKVHRVFTVSKTAAETKIKSKFVIGKSKESRRNSTTGSFIIMDYIHGKTVEQIWDTADLPTRESITKQVADMINKMQSTPLGGVLPPGPISVTNTNTDTDTPTRSASQDQGQRKWTGPWFTDYGAGPFATLKDLEAWLNHKIDVCIKVEELPPDWPRFNLKESDVVLTHQDIAPRNLIVKSVGDENEGGNLKLKVWLVDWQCAGVLPRGFEQAVLREQAQGNDEFVDMVEERLENKREDMVSQFRGIAYALSTGRLM